ncbi:MAG: HD domain-containing phosphohydrolase [Acidobacteriota bacterium]
MVEPADVRILIVDDDPLVCSGLQRILKAERFQCSVADSAESAQEVLSRDAIDIVLSDIQMPGASGLDLLGWIREQRRDVGVLMITGLNDRETAIQALQMGAFGYLTKPLNREELLINIWNSLERRRLNLISERYQRELETEVQRRTQELRDAQEEIVVRLMEAVECRDSGTGEHILRTGTLASEVARGLGWGSDEVELLRLAAPLHDVGKIGIPDDILQKPGRLTEEEFEEIKKHTTIGARILQGSGIRVLQMAREIALNHHERWDGAGYPNGLAGDEIPESARIVMIVDVYDALTSDRVYRQRIPEEEALELMRRQRGCQFDPRVFDCFLEVRLRVPAILEARSDQASPNGGDVSNCAGALSCDSFPLEVQGHRGDRTGSEGREPL